MQGQQCTFGRVFQQSFFFLQEVAGYGSHPSENASGKHPVAMPFTRPATDFGRCATVVSCFEHGRK